MGTSMSKKREKVFLFTLAFLLSLGFSQASYSQWVKFGGTGKTGFHGQRGTPGQSGRNVVVQAADENIYLRLRGGDGSPGRDGGRGNDGFNCWQRRGEWNMVGASGGAGGNGGNASHNFGNAGNASTASGLQGQSYTNVANGGQGAQYYGPPGSPGNAATFAITPDVSIQDSTDVVNTVYDAYLFPNLGGAAGLRPTNSPVQLGECFGILHQNRSNTPQNYQLGRAGRYLPEPAPSVGQPGGPSTMLIFDLL